LMCVAWMEEVFAPESMRAFMAGIFNPSKLHHSSLPMILSWESLIKIKVIFQLDYKNYFKNKHLHLY